MVTYQKLITSTILATIGIIILCFAIFGYQMAIAIIILAIFAIPKLKPWLEDYAKASEQKKPETTTPTKNPTQKINPLPTTPEFNTTWPPVTDNDPVWTPNKRGKTK